MRFLILHQQVFQPPLAYQAHIDTQHLPHWLDDDPQCFSKQQVIPGKDSNLIYSSKECFLLHHFVHYLPIDRWSACTSSAMMFLIAQDSQRRSILQQKTTKSGKRNVNSGFFLLFFLLFREKSSKKSSVSEQLHSSLTTQRNHLLLGSAIHHRITDLITDNWNICI